MPDLQDLQDPQKPQKPKAPAPADDWSDVPVPRRAAAVDDWSDVPVPTRPKAPKVEAPSPELRDEQGNPIGPMVDITSGRPVGLTPTAPPIAAAPPPAPPTPAHWTPDLAAEYHEPRAVPDEPQYRIPPQTAQAIFGAPPLERARQGEDVSGQVPFAPKPHAAAAPRLPTLEDRRRYAAERGIPFRLGGPTNVGADTISPTPRPAPPEPPRVSGTRTALELFRAYGRPMNWLFTPKSREQLEDEALNQMDPTFPGRVLIPGHRTFNAKTGKWTEIPPITGADVLDYAARAGVGVREALYALPSLALGALAEAGLGVANLGQLRYAPQLTEWLTNLANATRWGSRAAGAVEETAAAAANLAGYGIGRETLEQGPGVPALKTGAAYALAAPAFGAIPGAIRAPRIATTRALARTAPEAGEAAFGGAALPTEGGWRPVDLDPATATAADVDAAYVRYVDQKAPFVHRDPRAVLQLQRAAETRDALLAHIRERDAAAAAERVPYGEATPAEPAPPSRRLAAAPEFEVAPEPAPRAPEAPAAPAAAPAADVEAARAEDLREMQAFRRAMGTEGAFEPEAPTPTPAPPAPTVTPPRTAPAPELLPEMPEASRPILAQAIATELRQHLGERFDALPEAQQTELINAVQERRGERQLEIGIAAREIAEEATAPRPWEQTRDQYLEGTNRIGLPKEMAILEKPIHQVTPGEVGKLSTVQRKTYARLIGAKSTGTVENVKAGVLDRIKVLRELQGETPESLAALKGDELRQLAGRARVSPLGRKELVAQRLLQMRDQADRKIREYIRGLHWEQELGAAMARGEEIPPEVIKAAKEQRLELPPRYEQMPGTETEATMEELARRQAPTPEAAAAELDKKVARTRWIKRVPAERRQALGKEIASIASQGVTDFHASGLKPQEETAETFPRTVQGMALQGYARAIEHLGLSPDQALSASLAAAQKYVQEEAFANPALVGIPADVAEPALRAAHERVVAAAGEVPTPEQVGEGAPPEYGEPTSDIVDRLGEVEQYAGMGPEDIRRSIGPRGPAHVRELRAREKADLAELKSRNLDRYGESLGEPPATPYGERIDDPGTRNNQYLIHRNPVGRAGAEANLGYLPNDEYPWRVTDFFEGDAVGHKEFRSYREAEEYVMHETSGRWKPDWAQETVSERRPLFYGERRAEPSVVGAIRPAAAAPGAFEKLPRETQIAYIERAAARLDAELERQHVEPPLTYEQRRERLWQMAHEMYASGEPSELPAEPYEEMPRRVDLGAVPINQALEELGQPPAPPGLPGAPGPRLVKERRPKGYGRKKAKRPLTLPPQMRGRASVTPAYSKTLGAPLAGDSYTIVELPAISAELDRLGQAHPNPLASSGEWAKTMQEVFRESSGVVPRSPTHALQMADPAKGPAVLLESIKDLHQNPTPMGLAQRDAVQRGVDRSQDVRRLLEDPATPQPEIDRMVLGLLTQVRMSPKVGAYFSDAGTLELMKHRGLGGKTFDDFVADVRARDFNRGEFDAWVDELYPRGATGTGKVGATASNNARGLGAVLEALQQEHGGELAIDGVERTLRDPAMDGRAMRRALVGYFGAGTGLDTKTLSFLLVLSGKHDVIVLDRIQTRNMWKGAAGLGKVDPYTALASILNGPKGLAIYEALERGLAPTIDATYGQLGVVGSHGRYHWESWLVEGKQIVEHEPLLGHIAAGRGAPEPYAGISIAHTDARRVLQGIRYEPGVAAPFIVPTASGEALHFTQAQLTQLAKSWHEAASLLGVEKMGGSNVPWFERYHQGRATRDEIARRVSEAVRRGDLVDNDAARRIARAVAEEQGYGPAALARQLADSLAGRVAHVEEPATPAYEKKTTAVMEKRYGSDEGLGIRRGRNGTWEGKDAGPFDPTRCTSYACEVVRQHGQGRVVGYGDDENPSAQAAKGEGHDFAIIADRYIVDPWAKLTANTSTRAVFDLEDPADHAEIRRLYGNPSTWEELAQYRRGQHRLSLERLQHLARGTDPEITIEKGRPRDIGEALIKEFGETQVPEHAGFLLSDGRMVDFEGQDLMRGADHRSVDRIFDFKVGGKAVDPQTVSGGRWSMVQKVMDDGHARMHVDRTLVGIDLGQRLTGNQVRQLKEIVAQGEGERDLAIEFTKDGDLQATVQIPGAHRGDVDTALEELYAQLDAKVSEGAPIPYLGQPGGLGDPHVLEAAVARAAVSPGVSEGRAPSYGSAGFRGLVRGQEIPKTFTAGRVTFDNVDGIGAVPVAANIGYMGYVAWMTPGDFLRLNPPRDEAKRSAAFLAQALAEGKPIGMPFLEAKWDPDTKSWQVYGHEGRTRAAAIQALQGDLPIPIAVLPRPKAGGELRARHLTDEMVQARMYSDERQRVPYVTTPERVEVEPEAPYESDVERHQREMGLAEPEAPSYAPQAKDAVESKLAELRKDQPNPIERGAAIDLDTGEVLVDYTPMTPAPEGSFERAVAFGSKLDNAKLIGRRIVLMHTHPGDEEMGFSGDDWRAFGWGHFREQRLIAHNSEYVLRKTPAWDAQAGKMSHTAGDLQKRWDELADRLMWENPNLELPDVVDQVNRQMASELGAEYQRVPRAGTVGEPKPPSYAGVRRAEPADWPTRYDDRFFPGETRPLMTADGDYVLYHGTSAEAAQQIVAEGLRADDLGAIGLTTHPADAAMFGRLKTGRAAPNAIVEAVIDGKWLREQDITREGNHPGMWLIHGALKQRARPGQVGDLVIPIDKLKSARTFDDWEAAVAARPEAARAAKGGVAEGPPPAYGAERAADIGSGQFYSRVVRAAEGAKLTKATGREWDTYLAKQPMLRDEYDYTLQPWLREHADEKLTKEQVAEAARERQVRLTETVLGHSEAGSKARLELAKFEQMEERTSGETIDASNHFEDVGRGLGIPIRELAEMENAAAEGDFIPVTGTGSRELGAAAQRYHDALRDEQAAHDYLTKARREALSQVQPPKYAGYVEPGGKNYREVVIQLDTSKQLDAAPPADVRVEPAPYGARMRFRAVDDRGQVLGWGNTEAEARQGAGAYEATRRGVVPSYTSPHWEGIENPLVHVRMDDRTGPNGEKVLFVEEIQSDWHQAGREKGYLTQRPPLPWSESESKATGFQGDKLRQWKVPEGTPGTEILHEADLPVITELTKVGKKVYRYRGYDYPDLRIAKEAAEAFIDTMQVGVVPNAPFKRTEDWTGLAWRRVVDEAVRGGYDRIAWTTGAQQAKRYNLAQKVHRIEYDPQAGTLYGWTRDWDRSPDVIHDAKPEDLPALLGKELSRRLLEQKPVKSQRPTVTHRITGQELFPGGDMVHALEGDNLQVGGAGMQGFYDRMLPSVIRDWAKKRGMPAPIEEVDLDTETREGGEIYGGMTSPSIRVTPELAQAVRERGQELAEPEAPEYAGPPAEEHLAAAKAALKDSPDLQGVVKRIERAEAALRGEADKLKEGPAANLNNALAVLSGMDQLGEGTPAIRTAMERIKAAMRDPRTVAPYGPKVPADLLPLLDWKEPLKLTEDQTRVFGEKKKLRAAAESALKANQVPTLDQRLKMVPTKDPMMVEVIGKRLASPQDARLLYEPFRNPTSETIIVDLKKANRVVGRVAVIGGVLRQAVIDIDKVSDLMVAMADELGADGYAMNHNHPSGQVISSEDDRHTTAGLDVMQREKRQARGQPPLEGEHWITNFDKITRLTVEYEGRHVYVSEDANIPVKPAKKDGPDWTEMRGPELLGPESVVEAALQAPVPIADQPIHVFHRDNAGRAVALAPHEKGALSDIHRWLPQEMKAVGAMNAIIVLPMAETEMWEQLSQFAPKAVMDVIAVDPETGAYKSAVNEFKLRHRTPPAKPRAQQLELLGEKKPPGYKSKAEQKRERAAKLLTTSPTPEEALAAATTPGSPPLTPEQERLITSPPTEGLGDQVDLDKLELPPEASTGQPLRRHLERVVRAIQLGVNPEFTGPQARATADVIRARRAEAFRGYAIIKSHLRKIEQAIAGRPRREQLKIWAAFENGKPTGIPKLDDPTALPLLRKITESVTKGLVARDILRADALIENYTGRYWQVEPDEIRALEGIIQGKRPFRGPRTFLKHRTWAKITDGLAAIADAKGRIAAGEAEDGDAKLAAMRPLTYNVVRSQGAKLEEMLRAIAAHDIIADEMASNRYQWVMIGKDPPVDANGDPWERVDPTGKDPAFTKYGPRELPTGHKVAGSVEGEKETVYVPGRVELGYGYAPKPSAAVWHGALSKGIRGNPIFGPIYEAYMALGNGLTQVLLGFSGFHFGTISRESISASMELALSGIQRADTEAAIKAAAHALGAPGLDAVMGRRIMQQYQNPGVHPELEKGIRAMVAGGYRGTPENEWYTGERLGKLRDAFREAFEKENPAGRRVWNGVKVPFDVLWAGIELQIRPLMQYWVPWLKAAASYRATMDELAKMPPDLPLAEQRRRLSAVQKEMDYRYGQVVYDNYFMPRVVKDLAHAFFLAPGWTAGSAALLGRGATQVPYRLYRRVSGKDKGEPSQEVVGRTTRYVLASVLCYMMVNALLTYLYTGEQPKEKDLWFPRDGTMDPDGNPNRFVIPGYEGKDWYDWTNGFKGGPFTIAKGDLRTLMNKSKPVIGEFFRLVENRDYFGNMYYDPDHPTIGQLVGAAAKEIAPITVKNIQEQQRREQQGQTSKLSWLRNLIGAAPVKKEIQRTESQNLMASYLGRRGRTALTPEQQAQAKARADTVAALRRGEEIPEASAALVRRAEKAHLAAGFQVLTLEQKEEVYQTALNEPESAAKTLELETWEPLLEAARERAAGGTSRSRAPARRR